MEGPTTTVPNPGGSAVPGWIRPMGYGALVDRALKIYLAAFRPFLAISVINVIPTLIVMFAGLGMQQFVQPGNPVSMGGIAAAMGRIVLYGLSMLLMLLVYVWSKTAMMYMGSQHFLGRKCSFAEAAKVGLMLYGSTLGGMLLFWIFAVVVGLGCMFPPIILILVASKSLGSLFGMLGAVVFLMLLMVYVVIITRYWLWHQALVIEGKRGWDCMRRSYQMMKDLSDKGLFSNHIWELSVLLIIVGGIHLAVWMIGSIVPTMVHLMMSGVGSGLSDSLVAAFNFVSVLAQAVVTPLSALVVTLFYYNIRIRKEGLESQLRTAASAK